MPDAFDKYEAPPRRPVTRVFDAAIARCISHIAAQGGNRHVYFPVGEERFLDIDKGKSRFPEQYTGVLVRHLHRDDQGGYEREFDNKTDTMTPWKFSWCTGYGPSMSWATIALNQRLGIPLPVDTRPVREWTKPAS